MSSTPADRANSPSPTENQDSMAHEIAILEIAASFIRALGYTPPPFARDSILKDAVIGELHSWSLGESFDGLMKYLDVGLASAEVSRLSSRR